MVSRKTSRMTAATSAKVIYHPLNERYTKQAPRATKEIIRVAIAVAIKYPRASTVRLIGVTVRSLIVPFALSLIMSRFEQKATVIQHTARSEETS